MPPVEQLISFFIAASIFAFMPGPAILYTAAQTMSKGKRGGTLAAFGIHIGGLLHVTAAAAGLSAVFIHAPIAYTALKITGALYLDLDGHRHHPRQTGCQRTTSRQRVSG